MRAVCEVCHRPQPPDWKPGDFCVHCGKTARREVRCYWCVKSTPEGKFCRTCGAGLTDPRDFGAARMLKDAGADRFSIPKLLTELDPDQIETFRRIYQRHAAAVERRVDALRAVERDLFRKDWSSRHEDEMLPRLPLGEAELAALEAGGADPLTSDLAYLARLARGQEEDPARARMLLGHPDPDVRLEAAMVLSHWRAMIRWSGGSSGRKIVEELRREAANPAVALRIAYVTGEPTSADPLDLDSVFQSALARGDVEVLAGRADDPDPLARFAAGNRLAELGVEGPLARILPSLDASWQGEILRTLVRKRHAPGALRPTLFDLAERARDREVRSWALLALCPGCPDGEALRIARAAQGDSQVYQALLQRTALSPESLVDLGGFLLRENRFDSSAYGMSDIAKPGRMPAGFVPRHFASADDAGRVQMIRFAEMQLTEADDEDLHRFLIQVKFGPDYSPAVHSSAWSSLHRWYYRVEFGSAGPMTFGRAAADRFFGSFESFLGVLTGFLGRHASLDDFFVRDSFTRFLRYPDEDLVASLETCEAASRGLLDALARVCQAGSLDLQLRLECVALLGRMRTAPKLFVPADDALLALRDTDLDFAARRALGLASY